MVDDQPAKLLSYEAILANLDVHLIKARSGREGLELLLKHEIAVVLLDVSMPDINGFEMADIMRQHPRFQKTAILFISAVRMTDLDKIKGYKSGAVDYISVPVVPEVLRAKASVFVELYRKSKELEDLNRELETRVEQRTRQLQESESLLRERVKMAEAEEGLGLLALAGNRNDEARRHFAASIEASSASARCYIEYAKLEPDDAVDLFRQPIPHDALDQIEFVVQAARGRLLAHTALNIVPDAEQSAVGDNRWVIAGRVSQCGYKLGGGGGSTDSARPPFTAAHLPESLQLRGEGVHVASPIAPGPISRSCAGRMPSCWVQSGGDETREPENAKVRDQVVGARRAQDDA